MWKIIYAIAILALLALGLMAGVTTKQRTSDSVTMSVYEAELFIDGAIASHQYYIDHDGDQSFATGDTKFNQDIIKQYKRLKNLIRELSRD